MEKALSRQADQKQSTGDSGGKEVSEAGLAGRAYWKGVVCHPEEFVLSSE